MGERQEGTKEKMEKEMMNQPRKQTERDDHLSLTLYRKHVHRHLDFLFPHVDG